MGLSTRALKLNSPDPDLMWSRVSSTRHANYMHCTAGLDLTHCPGALSHSTARSLDPDCGFVGQSGLWIRIPDPHRIQIQGSMWRAQLSGGMPILFGICIMKVAFVKNAS